MYSDPTLGTAGAISFTHVYRGRRDRDRMVVGFTTTSVISAYHH
jgi:hypothetical protein